ncbi:hypothetical protein N431DRAFT_163974 [Stipitochalara longipes BDJ]|nr:hypothetical protein N431DRAFT_163974 [Stipitochalara longipes BDJ]
MRSLWLSFLVIWRLCWCCVRERLLGQRKGRSIRFRRLNATLRLHPRSPFPGARDCRLPQISRSLFLVAIIVSASCLRPLLAGARSWRSSEVCLEGVWSAVCGLRSAGCHREIHISARGGAPGALGTLALTLTLTLDPFLVMAATALLVFGLLVVPSCLPSCCLRSCLPEVTGAAPDPCSVGSCLDRPLPSTTTRAPDKLPHKLPHNPPGTCWGRLHAPLTLHRSLHEHAYHASLSPRTFAELSTLVY